MRECLNICIDLGSDSTKVAFAYIENDRFKTGKILEANNVLTSTISSNAFYNTKEKKWIFGVDSDKVNDPRFLHYVNIKKLLSLLIKNGSLKTYESNINYYFNQSYFPYFFFPDSKSYEDKYDYEEKVNKNDCFIVEDYTPSKLVEEYFIFVKKVIDDTFKRLRMANMTYKVSFVYPLRAGTAYIDELTRVIEKAFETKINRAICQTKALTILAKVLNKINEGDEFLVFDIGDEDISVSKAIYDKNGSILIEGRDGHNAPLNIGGNDIDETILNNIVSKYFNTGGLNNTNETMLLSKQYLLSKSIKQAKYILSSDKLIELFPEGVPVEMYKDTIITANITLDDFNDILGLDDLTMPSISSKFADYIVSELKQYINKDVKKVFISGGVIETRGLLSYIEDYVKLKLKKEYEFHSFEASNNSDDFYSINNDDGCSYASCVGCNFIAIKDIDVPVCLSLTYGSFLYEKGERCFKPFDKANRGAKLKAIGDTKFSLNSRITGPVDEEFFSIGVTMREINNKTIKGNGIKYSASGDLVVFNSGTNSRDNVVKAIDLKVVSGGAKGSQVILKHNNKYIRKVYLSGEDGIAFEEGLLVSPDGEATPFIRNTESTNRVVTVEFKNGSTKQVYSKDIKIEFEGVDSFIVSEG